METEIWPNVLAAARARGLPMILVNARLSERSRRRGARVDALLRPAFEGLAAALAQSDADATRLRDAGVASVGVVGNLKFDLAPDPAVQALGTRWKERVDRPVVLAAITREGEEATLLAAWHAVPLPRPLLVIVPRHPQRFEAVAELVVAAGFTLARRSAWRRSASARGGARRRLARRLDDGDAGLLRARRRRPARRQLPAVRRPEPDRGGGVRLPGRHGPAHLQLHRRRDALARRRRVAARRQHHRSDHRGAGPARQRRPGAPRRRARSHSPPRTAAPPPAPPPASSTSSTRASRSARSDRSACRRAFSAPATDRSPGHRSASAERRPGAAAAR